MNNSEFSGKVLQWFKSNKRDLPWRNTKNPYQIWLSEVILQQTRVKQGLPYYEKFVVAYPAIQDLATASEQEVLRLWQGLGYYSRARNMHTTAKFIVNELQGRFPDNYIDLLKLKGIGKYSAAAIASFAFDEKVAVLDGNVYRVLSRIFGIDTPINSKQGNKIFSELAFELLPEKEISTYNQAIMEFGAIQCTPTKPDCMYCLLSENCSAALEGKQDYLPVKINKIKMRKRFFHYLIFEEQGRLALNRRSQKDIWEGLYDFFLIEDTAFRDIDYLLSFANLPKNSARFVIEKESEEYKHQLTHQLIRTKFWHIHINELIDLEKMKDLNLIFFSLEEIKDLPKSILIDKYLQKYFF